MEDSDRLLKVSEAGRFLGLADVTIRKMASTGELPIVRLAGKRAIRFKRSDVEALVRMREPVQERREG